MGTVKHLIEQLQQFNPDLEVGVFIDRDGTPNLEVYSDDEGPEPGQSIEVAAMGVVYFLDPKDVPVWAKREES